MPRQQLQRWLAVEAVFLLVTFALVSWVACQVLDILVRLYR